MKQDLIPTTLTPELSTKDDIFGRNPSWEIFCSLAIYRRVSIHTQSGVTMWIIIVFFTLVIR